MRSLSCIALLLFSTTAFAQGEPPEFHKFQVGLNFSPDIGYRVLKNNDGSSASNYVITSRDEREIVKPGFTSGLNVIYNFNTKFGIELGIQYSAKGYQTPKESGRYGSMIDPRTGFYYSPGGRVPTAFKLVWTDHYLDIPLKVNYLAGKRKIRFIASAGIVTNVFMKETVTAIVEYEDGSRDKNRRKTTDDYNRIDLSPMLSAGIDWQLGNRSNIRIEPTARYGVLKIINDPVTGYLWTAGLNISYYLGFK